MDTIHVPEGLFEDAVDPDGTKHSRLTLDGLVVTLGGEITRRSEGEIYHSLSIKVDSFMAATVMREVLMARHIWCGHLVHIGERYLLCCTYDPSEVK
jgi:hypothetical protein